MVNENETTDLSGAPDTGLNPAAPPPVSIPPTPTVNETPEGVPTRRPEDDVLEAIAEETGEKVVKIWDENNVLVHPEMDRQAKLASQVALGEITAEAANKELKADIFDVAEPRMTPLESQAQEGQTRDPMTSPQPVMGIVT